MPHRQLVEEIIIFTRYPEPGKVKTRLVPFLGKEETALMHRRLSEQIIRQVLRVQEIRPVLISLFYSGGSLQQMKNWLKYQFIYEKQQGADIGIRMAAAFQSAWKRGRKRAVLIGTDCPLMNADLLEEALDKLRTNDVVLGPANDGGYYLIGLHDDLPAGQFDSLFVNIAWGSADVFKQTVNRARKYKLRIATLEQLHDIDRVEDLEHFRHYPHPQ